MEENRYKRPRRGPQYGSIDGFVRPRTGSRGYTSFPPRINKNVRQSSVANTPMPTRATLPAPVPIYKKPNSLVNRAIPDLTAYRPQPVKVKKKLSKKKIILRGAICIIVLFIGIAGFFGIKDLNNVNKVFHGNFFSDVKAAFVTDPLKGENAGRVNILLAGDSSDDPNHQGSQLTDSILILSINTKNHTAFLLSIPRDLWVYVPGLNSYQKINAANDVSSFNQSGYPKGGMGQLEQIIQTNLGIPIDYYGLMDYGAFKDAVNAVGGVTIDIQSPDPYGIYDSNCNIKLPNGLATLNGDQALALARARGDGYGSYGFPDSDFDRTEHQRQLFTGVASKAKSLGVLANPVKISDLFNALGNNFQTDMSLQNVLRLVQVTKGVNLSAIQSYTYSSTLSSTTPNPILKTYTDPASGQESLIPSNGIGDYSQMEQYYLQLTSSNPVVKEAPNVVILNASGATGLASKQRSILQTKGFNVVSIANADRLYPGTMIVNESNGSKPNSLKLLQQLYPGTTVTSETGSTEAIETQGYTANFVVILGQNWNTTAKSQ